MSKKCKPLWMPLYIEKFLADTSILTSAEGWAYLNLLCHMWRSDDGTLPNDPDKLSRAAKVYRPRWGRVWSGIKSLFDIDGDRVTNTDLQRELGMANAKIVMNRAAGSLGGQTTKWKRTLRHVDNSIHTPTMNAIHTSTMTAPNSLKNNNVGAANAVANGVANYNYKSKEEKERSGEPRPETGSPSLEEGLQRKRMPENHTIPETERNTNLAKLNDLRRKLNGG